MAKKDILETVGIVLLILFGAYLIYQLARILLGGSWSPEDIIIALLTFTLGLTVVILRKSDLNEHRVKSLQKSFSSLVKDFKEHMNNYHYSKK